MCDSVSLRIVLYCRPLPAVSLLLYLLGRQSRHTVCVFVKVIGFCCADLAPKVCIYPSLVQVRDVLVFHQIGSFMFSLLLVNC